MTLAYQKFGAYFWATRTRYYYNL